MQQFHTDRGKQGQKYTSKHIFVFSKSVRFPLFFSQSAVGNKPRMVWFLNYLRGGRFDRLAIVPSLSIFKPASFSTDKYSLDFVLGSDCVLKLTNNLDLQ